MKKLILCGCTFMLALCVLGCVVTDNVIPENRDTLSDAETFDKDESHEVEESIAYDTVQCYILAYDEDNAILTYDLIEWINPTDSDRIEALDLDIEYDFPNGFYLYNEDESTTSMSVADTVEIYLVNIEDSFDPIITDMNGLLERQTEYKAPYQLKIFNDEIYIIEEQFIP